MNLVLLERAEVDASGRAHLPAHDRRARHLREVLGVAPGRELQVGVADGPLGTARVESAAAAVDLACRFEPTPPPRPADVLVLAVARPKVVARCVEHAAALGFAHIVLLRTWHTDKSHVRASQLALAALRARADAGLEQARRTWRPTIAVEPLFRPFVEDRLAAACAGATRLVAHPGAARDLRDLAALPDAPVALVLGPERGLVPFELDLLAAQGFAPIAAGAHPQRVEVALPWVYGQLALLRRGVGR